MTREVICFWKVWFLFNCSHHYWKNSRGINSILDIKIIGTNQITSKTKQSSTLNTRCGSLKGRYTRLHSRLKNRMKKKHPLSVSFHLKDHTTVFQADMFVTARIKYLCSDIKERLFWHSHHIGLSQTQSWDAEPF